MKLENTENFALELDKQDVLAPFRSEFLIPFHQNKQVVYFTGNSLGLQAKGVKELVLRELHQWETLGVEGHFKGDKPWLSYHEHFPALLSPIVGALPEELVVMNQLTVNLHLLMTSFYRPTKEKFKIICEEKAFPSDQYALESQVLLHGFDPTETIIEVKPRPGAYTIEEADMLEAIETHRESLALVLFGGVNYYSGQFYNLKSITQAAHKVGAFAGFDLAHAAGNVPLQLHDWDVDFACWCSYKYLNSGPGGVAGAFIHQKHIAKSLPRLAGWWGHDKTNRFKMEKGFSPIPTAEGWQLSNAPVLSMAAHLASLEVFQRAGMENLHQKRKLQSAFLDYILAEIQNKTSASAFTILTPKAVNERGCQVSLLVPKQGKAIFNFLEENGVVADWREPDVIRIAPVPMYNSFLDIWKFGQQFEKAIQFLNL